MKKFSFLAMVFVLLACSLGVTLQQATVSPVFTALKFKQVPPSDNKVGGPVEFKITKNTLEFLRKLRREEKNLVIMADGSIGTKSPDGKVEMIEMDKKAEAKQD